MNLDLVKTFVAGGAINARALVKPDSTAGQVVAATAATDFLIGVCVQPSGAASADRVDVAMEGLIEVVAGGTIAAGDPITAGAAGVAVTAAPSAGVNNRLIGFAYEAGVVGDIIRVIYSPCLMQG